MSFAKDARCVEFARPTASHAGNGVDCIPRHPSIAPLLHASTVLTGCGALRMREWEVCHTTLLFQIKCGLRREGCSGSIFLSVQYEECEDIDAIESTRAKVGTLLQDLATCGSTA